MADILLANESLIRLSCFGGVLLGMMVLEWVMPCRLNKIPKKTRWVANLGLILIDTLAVRLLIPILPAAFALYCTQNHWGLFHVINFPSIVVFTLSLLLLDMMIYGQHVLVHKVPLLWRFHKVHHTDTELDVTSGVRFHPVEILFSVVFKLGVVGILGTPAVAVIVFEVLLNGTSLFNHSNIKLSPRMDRALRLFLVTPDMHRVHHSTVPQETDSNFGFNLPWWDEIFNTYKAQPYKGHQDMDIGLTEYRDSKGLNLFKLVQLPFKK